MFFEQVKAPGVSYVNLYDKLLGNMAAFVVQAYIKHFTIRGPGTWVLDMNHINLKQTHNWEIKCILHIKIKGRNICFA